MRPDAFWQHKRLAQVGDTQVAYLDQSDGPPLLLHGCPLSSFVWRKTIPLLTPHYRCIAPDLLGLGDTQTPPGADWSLPAQATTVLGLLDTLHIDAAHLVGHDHGAAIAQLLAADHRPSAHGGATRASRRAHRRLPRRARRHTHPPVTSTRLGR